ncbi:hypothetical protein AB0M43_34875 [Longispora sp. NPDC051575]|uniref:hypothetical protein n=1 Tax=Longispora sp. NPDC051575 TaxID=3154943 RepID=UPI0034476ED7
MADDARDEEKPDGKFGNALTHLGQLLVLATPVAYFLANSPQRAFYGRLGILPAEVGAEGVSAFYHLSIMIVVVLFFGSLLVLTVLAGLHFIQSRVDRLPEAWTKRIPWLRKPAVVALVAITIFLALTILALGVQPSSVQSGHDQRFGSWITAGAANGLVLILVGMGLWIPAKRYLGRRWSVAFIMAWLMGFMTFQLGVAAEDAGDKVRSECRGGYAASIMGFNARSVQVTWLDKSKMPPQLASSAQGSDGTATTRPMLLLGQVGDQLSLYDCSTAQAYNVERAGASIAITVR